MSVPGQNLADRKRRSSQSRDLGWKRLCECSPRDLTEARVYSRNYSILPEPLPCSTMDSSVIFSKQSKRRRAFLFQETKRILAFHRQAWNTLNFLFPRKIPFSLPYGVVVSEEWQDAMPLHFAAIKICEPGPQVRTKPATNRSDSGTGQELFLEFCVLR